MHKRSLALVASSLLVVLFAAPAVASSDLPANSSALGQSRSDAAKSYMQWFYGDADNPLLSGECGEVVGHVFLMVPPTDTGLTYDCEVPKGVPIVFSHAGYMAWVQDDGNTDQELEATAAELFGDPPGQVVVDGQQVSLTTIETGAFDVVSEPGSLYDVIFGLGTGVVRSAAALQLTLLHPLRPGNHTVEATVDFTGSGGPIYDARYNVTVG